MNSLSIRSNSTWVDLQQHFINHKDGESDVKQTNSRMFALENTTPQTLCSRIRAFFTCRSPINDKIAELIKDRLRNDILLLDRVKYERGEECAIDNVFNELLTDCEVSYSELKIFEKAQKVFDKAAGCDRKFIEAVNPGDVDYKLDIRDATGKKAEVINAINTLLGGNFDRHLVSCGLVKAVLFCKDPERMRLFTEGLQEVINKTHATLLQPHPTPSKVKFAKMLMLNILALLPFTDPANGSQINVPQLINKRWEMVTYRIEVLPITSEWLGKPIPALGLKQVNNPQAQPLLIFRGTPQPTADGSLPALASDAVPGKTVGEVIYNRSWVKELLQKWIKDAYHQFLNDSQPISEANVKEKSLINQIDSRGVIIVGQSLGASLAIIAGSHQPEFVSEIHGFGSPAPLAAVREIYERRKNDTGCKPEFHLYWNFGDKVPKVGTGFHPDWHIHKLFIPKSQWRLVAHACANAAVPKTIMVGISPVVDAKLPSRTMTNLAKEIQSVVMFPVTLSLLAAAFLKTLIVTVCLKVCEAVKYCFGRRSPHSRNPIEL